MARGFKRGFKPLNILREEEVEAVHRGVLDVLDETGVVFDSPEALQLFEKNGFRVDHGAKRVRFPASLVEECLRKCPPSFRLRARNRENDLVIGGDTFHFMSFPGMETVDLDTWHNRMPTREEYYDLITVMDALPNLHIVGSYPYFGFAGLDPVMMLPECMAGKMRNSDKCYWTDYEQDSEIFVIEMAKATGTDAMGMCMASPPLRYPEAAYKAAKRFTDAGYPVAVLSGCVHGVSGPATVAGSLVTDTAELVAGIVMVQLLKPGTPVLTNNFTFPANMRTGYHDFGGIARCLHQAASNQIWRRYGIPKWNGAVGITNAKSIDFQCGYERTTAALIGALSGAHIIQLHSGLYGELTAHPVQAILDDDIAGMIGRFAEGIKFNDETLALDLIHAVGPSPGFYLDKEHTRDFWRLESYTARAADYTTYQEWERTGKKSALDLAKERMAQILAEHKVKVPLTAAQEEAICRILDEAREFYKKRGMLGR